jgi:uncharacterized membrane protein
MKVENWLVPICIILIVVGIFLQFLLEHHSFQTTQDLEFRVLSTTSFPVLMAGTIASIIAAFFVRRSLPAAQTRTAGILCWAASGISYALLATVGNVHGWTSAFMFPMFAGFVAGAILLSKLADGPT